MKRFRPSSWKLAACTWHVSLCRNGKPAHRGWHTNSSNHRRQFSGHLGTFPSSLSMFSPKHLGSDSCAASAGKMLVHLEVPEVSATEIVGTLVAAASRRGGDGVEEIRQPHVAPVRIRDIERHHDVPVPLAKVSAPEVRRGALAAHVAKDDRRPRREEAPVKLFLGDVRKVQHRDPAAVQLGRVVRVFARVR